MLIPAYFISWHLQGFLGLHMIQLFFHSLPHTFCYYCFPEVLCFDRFMYFKVRYQLKDISCSPYSSSATTLCTLPVLTLFTNKVIYYVNQLKSLVMENQSCTISKIIIIINIILNSIERATNGSKNHQA